MGRCLYKSFISILPIYTAGLILAVVKRLDDARTGWLIVKHASAVRPAIEQTEGHVMDVVWNAGDPNRVRARRILARLIAHLQLAVLLPDLRGNMMEAEDFEWQVRYNVIGVHLSSRQISAAQWR